MFLSQLCSYYNGIILKLQSFTLSGFLQLPDLLYGDAMKFLLDGDIDDNENKRHLLVDKSIWMSRLHTIVDEITISR